MLSGFLVAQIVFDVAVVAAAVVYMLTRPGPPRTPDPPEWYAQFLRLAQELMTATEPVLARLEAPPAPPEPALTPARPRDRYEEARGLLRSGIAPDAVAFRSGLHAGEIRLLAKVVAAESRRGRR